MVIYSFGVSKEGGGVPLRSPRNFFIHITENFFLFRSSNLIANHSLGTTLIYSIRKRIVFVFLSLENLMPALICLIIRLSMKLSFRALRTLWKLISFELTPLLRTGLISVIRQNITQRELQANFTQIHTSWDRFDCDSGNNSCICDSYLSTVLVSWIVSQYDCSFFYCLL